MVVNPTANSRRTTVAITKVNGKPVPLPMAMPSGTGPPITPSGDAAATTMNTIEATPRLPRRRERAGAAAMEEAGTALVWSSMAMRALSGRKKEAGRGGWGRH